ncbi:hypothetical protein CUD01_16290 [Cellulomonas uda]|uniref:Uncharacterized protein n=1 Tax=Cellulomonas uda TaxID=1714 RepID=A0A4Y3KDU0_CELUD|nr:hypothetical protein CUD01_16290 [Cellulomonas uda]
MRRARCDRRGASRTRTADPHRRGASRTRTADPHRRGASRTRIADPIAAADPPAPQHRLRHPVRSIGSAPSAPRYLTRRHPPREGLAAPGGDVTARTPLPCVPCRGCGGGVERDAMSGSRRGGAFVQVAALRDRVKVPL